jgi:phenylalanyl-tRNA synthetase beta chain
VGVAAINNVVDITNYVLLECGQPLHAFDLARLAGREIIVRNARASEEFVAITHKTYTLESGMCVIADAERAVALGGVMGGADTEVTERTTELLIESAEFDPMSIRNTARRLNLHSDSSYRFERGLDPQGVEWASRRACELILELAGGELAAGVLDIGRPPTSREPIVLRLAQLKRILGIEINPAEARRILAALGNEELRAGADRVEVIPPSWRRDLMREIDLVEEVARIHGYDAIPEDVSVPMAPSHRTREDRVLAQVRHVLTAAGFDEAMTLSAVEESWSEAFSPWTDAPPLRCYTPVLRRADTLRRSLLPSLLGARRMNETLANEVIELFEIAKVYLPQAGQALPSEDLLLAMTSGGDYFALKGVLEGLAAALNPSLEIQARPAKPHELLDSERSSQLWLTRGSEERLLGYLGEVSGAGQKRFELRGSTAVAEIRLAPLVDLAQLIPQYEKLPAFPATTRDLNLVVDESVRWSDLAHTVRSTAVPYGERLEYLGIYRDEKQLGAGKKSLLMRLTLRSHEATLTNDEADQIRDRIVAACRERHGAELRT